MSLRKNKIRPPLTTDAELDTLEQLFAKKLGHDKAPGHQLTVREALLKLLLKKATEGSVLASKVLEKERAIYPALKLQLTGLTRPCRDLYPLVIGSVCTPPQCVEFHDFCAELNNGMTEERWQYYVALKKREYS